MNVTAVAIVEDGGALAFGVIVGVGRSGWIVEVYATVRTGTSAVKQPPSRREQASHYGRRYVRTPYSDDRHSDWFPESSWWISTVNVSGTRNTGDRGRS